jgi:hypothetical protein
MTLEQQLKQKIKEALTDVTKVNAPKIYGLIQSEQGYKVVETEIVSCMALNNITAKETILIVENQL